MKQFLKKLFSDKKGATIVEYALLVALVSIAALFILMAIGPKIQSRFQQVSEALDKTSVTSSS